MIDRFLGDAFGVLSCPFLEYCSEPKMVQNSTPKTSQCHYNCFGEYIYIYIYICARLPIHTLNNWSVQSEVPIY